MESINKNILIIRNKIEEVKKRCLIDKDIEILAAVKDRKGDEIIETIKSGIKYLGENRVQEAEEHLKEINSFRDQFKYHFIGRLQTNKVKKAVKIFDSIDSVDSLRLASLINKEANKNDKFQEVLIEINLGEEQKGGVKIDEIFRLFDEIIKMENLKIRGLMAVPPFSENPEDSRPYFKKVYNLYQKIRKEYNLNEFNILSLGMSHDFEVAIEEGANLVRIGTAIFGPRSRK